METNRASCVVEIVGRRVRVRDHGRKEGERVVVSVRPEFIPLVRSSGSGSNGWRGRVKQVTFLGSITRYRVEIEEGLELVAHVPAVSREEFHVGERVDALLDQVKHMLLFDFPEEGLENEIALE
jgi:ABC-type Fe3+/spermidine/putrescine transport system ATPase subunit